MNYLRCKTPEGGSAYRIIKVYFCCHPEDHELYFETVTEEIFKHLKCAVFYDDSGSDRNDEFLSQLTDMRLFVMPVTQKLLITPNYALSREFAFAKEHNIPILPLMQEKGLDNLFNKRCGAIQYLDIPDKNDKSSKSQEYHRKLGKFLSSITAGSGMAEKIRSAFDAHVFLSYRKKDRELARRLMSLIHENDALSGIAIWYDDYLIPGENYNDTIRDAIRECDIFVMSVTPNMVNEYNYVESREFPEACASGKQIIPCEMVATDRELLGQKFKNIPETVDAYNGEEMTARFLNALRALNITVRESTPERDYLIGLAYLEGIDVEADNAKALRLITSAAKRGYPDAMEKLAEMYLNGGGVEKNVRIGRKWCRDCIKATFAALEKNGSPEDAERYLKALYFKLCNSDNIRGILEAPSDFIKLHKEALRLQGEGSFYVAFYHYVISFIYSLIKTSKYDAYASNTIKLIEQLPQTKETARWICDLYIHYCDTVNRYKDTDLYIKYCINAIKALRQIFNDYPGAPDIESLSAYFYLSNLNASTFLYFYHNDKKKKQSEIDLKIIETIDSAIQDVEVKQILIQCYYYRYLASYNSSADDKTESSRLNYLLKAEKHAEQLVALTNSLLAYELYIEIISSIGGYSLSENEQNAFEFYNKVFALVNNVGLHNLSPNAKLRIASIYHILASKYEKNATDGLSQYDNSSNLIEDVLNETFDKKMDSIESDEQRSLELYRTELSIYEDLSEKHPEKTEYLEKLLAACCDMVQRLKRGEACQSYAEKAVAIANELKDINPNHVGNCMKWMYEFLSIYADSKRQSKDYKRLAKEYERLKKRNQPHN